MLMWGPLKDTGKEGFSVRRQAEKQQPVYRLTLLCAANLAAASCEASPSFFLLSAPRPPSSPPHISCSSVMHGGIPWTETDLFSSPSFSFAGPLSFFLSCLKAEQRGYSEKKNALTLLFVFCHTLLCILLALYRLALSLLSGNLSI